ncbi:ERGIC53, mannose lectin, ER-golgi intermediate compartment [Phlegmacium glaucopus]|nr:ERGIC53, mannose lectin, ER-golgi intermediate compartment [Phlegmacium glaucopus]
MLSRCMNSALTAALLISGLLVGFAQAGTEEKTVTRLGNQTIERTLQLRTHSIYAPYIDQDLQNRWWDFGADAYINTNKHIRLTNNWPSQMGWLWSRLAFTATNFVIEIEFKVSGGSSHLYGDGMAVWLTKDRVQPGPVFGNKDEFEGLGIFLDTYANGHHDYDFPMVIGVLGDGKTKYNNDNDGIDQSIGHCSANYRRTNVATKLKLTYVKDNFLDVKVQYKAWDDWTDCFFVSKIALPPNPFLGFTALTGDVSDSHDIISITSYTAILSQVTSEPNKLNKTVFTSSGGGTWLGFFFKLFLFAGIVAGGYYGYQEYLRRQRYGDGINFGARLGGFSDMISGNRRY